jgi:hypothetical protein
MIWNVIRLRSFVEVCSFEAFRRSGWSIRKWFLYVFLAGHWEYLSDSIVNHDCTSCSHLEERRKQIGLAAQRFSPDLLATYAFCAASSILNAAGERPVIFSSIRWAVADHEPPGRAH